MSDPIRFPVERTGRDQRRLAAWFRELADIIESGEAETDPHAALVVLTGRDRHELLNLGYMEDGHGFEGAAMAAEHARHCSFDTIGGNVRPRSHYGGRFRRTNNVSEIIRRKEPTDV